MRSSRRLHAAAFVVAALALALAAIPAAAALRSVGAVVQSLPSADGVELRLASGARVRVGFATPDAVRVRMSPTGSFGPDVSYAIDAAPPKARAMVTRKGGATELRSATATRVVIKGTPELAISVYDSAGRLVVADDPARPMAFNTKDGAIETSMRRDDYELYYGFGEKTFPLSRHQQSIARAYFELGQDLTFFGKIQRGRKDLLGQLSNMAWDLWHIRQLEEGPTLSIRPEARYYFTALLTFDKRLIEIMDLYALRSFGYNARRDVQIPVYSGDWFHVIGGGGDEGQRLFDRFYSEAARRSRDDRREAAKANLTEIVTSLEVELRRI